MGPFRPQQVSLWSCITKDGSHNFCLQVQAMTDLTIYAFFFHWIYVRHCHSIYKLNLQRLLRQKGELKSSWSNKGVQECVKATMVHTAWNMLRITSREAWPVTTFFNASEVSGKWGPPEMTSPNLKKGTTRLKSKTTGIDQNITKREVGK